MLGGDKTGALELPRRIFVARAPQEILVIEPVANIIPATIAGMIIDHPIGCIKFVRRVRESRNHHDRRSTCPGEPRKPARETNKKLGVCKPTRTLSNRSITRLILCALRQVMPNQACPMDSSLVDADNAITRLLQESDDVVPTSGVVPVFALRRALHCDADIRLSDRSTVVDKRQARGHLGRSNTKDETRRAMQPNMTEVRRLPHEMLVVEEQAQIVCRVILVRLYAFMGNERDIGISIPEQRNQFLSHAACQAATVALLELHRIRKPANRIAQRADRELDQHVAIRGRVFMREHTLALLQDFHPKAHEIALGAVHTPGFEFGIKQNVAGIEIAEPDTKGVLRFRNKKA